MLRAAVVAVRRHGSALVLSGASQAVSSLTSFGIALYLIRVLDKEQFGLYGLGLAVLLALAGLLGAVYGVQLVVNLPDQPNECRPTYAMHHAVALMMTGVGASLVALLIGVVVGLARQVEWPTVWLALPIALSAIAFATRDILIRIAYAERRGSAVLWANAVTAIGVAAVFVIPSINGMNVTAEYGLYAYAIGQLAGLVPLLSNLRLPWRDVNIRELEAAFAQAWKGGRWHVLTSLVYSVRTQGHNFVIAPMIGLGALAEVNAARVFLAPAVMLMPSIYQLMLPRMAERRAADEHPISRVVSQVTLGLAGGAAVYSMGVLALLGWLQPLALGPRYGDVSDAVLAWAFVTVLLAARNGLSMGQEVMKSFRWLFGANLLAAATAVGLSVPLALTGGAVGTVWALAGAELFLTVVLARGIYRRTPSAMKDGQA